MDSNSLELQKENKSLKRKIKLMEQTLSQFDSIKNNYSDLIKRLEEKDQKLLQMNEKLEILVKDRTKELESINERLKDLSVTDSLTGLKNRRSFDEIFSQEFNRAKRQDYFFDILIIDVDNFKKYNDTYGHSKGDFVLSQVGQVLDKFSRRSNDFVFRYGGEEFVYLSCFHDKNEFFKTAEAIRKAVEKENITHKTTPLGFVTISLGGIVTKNKVKSKEDIFVLADDNLYKSKKEGRNRTTLTFCD